MKITPNKKKQPLPSQMIPMLTLCVLFCFSCSNQGSIGSSQTSSKIRNVNSLSLSAYLVPNDGDPTQPVEVLPAPVVEQPALVVEQPAPVVVQPAPVAEQPAPVVVQPAPVAEQPAPVAEQPALVVEQPAPVAEQPALVVVQPAPQYPSQMRVEIPIQIRIGNGNHVEVSRFIDLRSYQGMRIEKILVEAAADYSSSSVTLILNGQSATAAGLFVFDNYLLTQSVVLSHKPVITPGYIIALYGSGNPKLLISKVSLVLSR